MGRSTCSLPSTYLQLQDSAHRLIAVSISPTDHAYRRITLRKRIVSMNTSTRVGQCATVFSILSLFNYPLNEAACPPVSTVYSPIMPSKDIYTLMRIH